MDWEKDHHGYQLKKEWMRVSPGVVAALYWSVNMYTQPGDSVIDLQNLRQLLRLGNALRENQLLIVVVTPEFGFDGVFHGQSQVDGQGEEKSQHRQGDGPGPALNVLPEQLKK